MLRFLRIYFFCAAALALCSQRVMLGQSAVGIPGPLMSSSSLTGPVPFRENRAQRSQRELQFLKGRIFPSQRSAALLNRAYQQKMGMRVALAATSKAAAVSLTAGSGWSAMGPAPFTSNPSSAGYELYGPVSGRATAVAIDPADTSGNTVYVGGANGGLWRSTNAGQVSPDPSTVQWTPLIDNQPSLAIGAIAVQPQPAAGTSVVIVGTGETNSSTDSYYGQGILRGVLNAANQTWSWTQVTQDTTQAHSFLGLGFSQIAFSADNNNLVVAAAAGASLGLIDGLESSPTADLGLYYSADAGLTWNYANITDNGATIAPSSATAVVYNQAAHAFFAVIRFHGVYASTDGINWSRLANQPGPGLSAANCPVSPSSSTCPIYRGELAVTTGRDEMYAWYVDANDTDQGIWLSTNGGNTWPVQVSTTKIDSCGDPLGGCGTQDGSYNLTLGAAPNGTGNTDLYAGAVNIYKCEITGLPASPTACDGTETLGFGFLNLTHVYGCAPDFGAPAHVHPSQHAMDLLQVNAGNEVVMYFANDGGIYRTIDGYSRLLSGDCSGTNGFDDLNQTLGSLSEFISLAQDPGDASTLVGGAQGNGFPATQDALLSSAWGNANTGNGGYAEVNPANPAQWFTATGGVNIEACSNGASCDLEDFASGLVVSSATVGGDVGPLDTPFMVDPAVLSTGGASDLIVGTCRVWRGGMDGSGFAALSPNFDALTGAICSGYEVNLVRSLAAGGPLDASGASSMIYAGTDGWGPLVTTNPSGGHLWATDPNNGPGVWIDRTTFGTININPGQFPISAVAVDDTDTSGIPGQVAYAAIGGFAASRVWKTATAGAIWFDMTADLPDAPVNALAVDPGQGTNPGTLYAATDVGVFARSADPATTDNPVWTEVGPTPGSGQSGYLPDAPVTALRIYNDATTKLLRAATYGRGIWQYVLSVTPSFFLTAPNPEQTVFGSQATTFSLDLSSVNGYNSPVNLTCTASGGATCTAPAQWAWTQNEGSFTVSVPSVAPGDYTISVTAAGTDLQQITRGAALTLHVVDYQLSTPVPASATVVRGNSATILFQVSAGGDFNSPVSLGCGGLPTGAACTFTPGSVSPVAGQPVSVTLVMSTATATLTATSTITITASAPGVPDQTQDFSLTVVDYDLMFAQGAPTSASLVQGTTSTTTSLEVTADGSFDWPVSLACASSAGISCQFSPAGVVNPMSGLPVNVDLTISVPAGTAVGTYPVVITASTPDGSSRSETFPVNVTDYELTPQTNPTSTSLVEGNTSPALSFQVSAFGGFNAPVSFTCGNNLPAGVTCLFSPSPASPVANQPVTVSLTVTSNIKTPTGSYSIMIVATTPGATQRTSGFTLIVTAAPDYSLSISNPVLSAVVGQPAVFNGTLTSVGGYNTAVTLNCDQNAPATCTVSPQTVTPTASGAPFTVTVSSSLVQSFNFDIEGTNPSAPGHAQPVSFNSVSATFSFTFNPVTSSQDILAGGIATYSLDLNPTGGPFPSVVSFSQCSGLPALTTCTLNPPELPAGSGETQINLTIATTASVLASDRPVKLAVLSFGLVGFVLAIPAARRKRRRFAQAWVVFVVIGLVASGCGGGGNLSGNVGGSGSPGTPAGTYTITLTATTGSLQQTAMVTLIVEGTSSSVRRGTVAKSGGGREVVARHSALSGREPVLNYQMAVVRMSRARAPAPHLGEKQLPDVSCSRFFR